MCWIQTDIVFFCSQGKENRSLGKYKISLIPDHVNLFLNIAGGKATGRKIQGVGMVGLVLETLTAKLYNDILTPGTKLPLASTRAGLYQSGFF